MTFNYEILIQMLHVYIMYYYIVHNIYICIYNIGKDSVNRGALGKCFVEREIMQDTPPRISCLFVAWVLGRVWIPAFSKKQL